MLRLLVLVFEIILLLLLFGATIRHLKPERISIRLTGVQTETLMSVPTGLHSYSKKMKRSVMFWMEICSVKVHDLPFVEFSPGILSFAEYLYVVVIVGY